MNDKTLCSEELTNHGFHKDIYLNYMNQLYYLFNSK